MKRSLSQIFLLIVSIINTVIGVVLLVGGILTVISGASISGETASQVAETGISVAEQASTSKSLMEAGGLVGIMAVVSLATSLLCIRASGNRQKILFAWIVSLAGLAGYTFIVFHFRNHDLLGQSTLPYVVGLVGAVLVFAFATTVLVQNLLRRWAH